MLLIDLDDTIIDRSGAFAQWAHRFAASQAGTTQDGDWIIAQDNGGNLPRIDLARAIKNHFNLLDSPEELLAGPMTEHLGSVCVFDGVFERLEQFRSLGWSIVVVTNGMTDRQLAKIESIGLGRYIDGVVVSQSSGAAKPAPKIFDDALALVPHSNVVWMVGDNGVADILGGNQRGFSTAWISLGRTWDFEHSPTFTAETTSQALDQILKTAATN